MLSESHYDMASIYVSMFYVYQEMRTFQINVLIQFLASSTCLEHHVFVIREATCTCSLYDIVLYIIYIYITAII
jgi:hypothetical protein